MRLWLQNTRDRMNKNKRYASGAEGVISKSLSELSMSGTAVAVDGPRFMTNMRSEKQDRIQYLSVDDIDRRRYWRSGEERDDIWRKLSRPKLSILVASKLPESILLDRQNFYDYFLYFLFPAMIL